MNSLCVFYDETCQFCVRCALWLSQQATYLPLACTPAGAPENRSLQLPKGELVVMDDEGGLYSGTDAWLMTLWATVKLRPWAQRLATPTLAPLARAVFKSVSNNRQVFSSWLAQPDDRLTQFVTRNVPFVPDSCENGACVTGAGKCASCQTPVSTGRELCAKCLAAALTGSPPAPV